MKGNTLNWRALALAFGILCGVYLGLSVLLAMSGIQLMGFSQDVVVLLQSIFPMLTVTWGGVFAGLGIGLLCGTICGALLGWLYNVGLGLPANLRTNERLGRLVLGLVLLWGGDYAGGLVGGIVILLGSIFLAEAIIGYCWLVHKVWR